MNGNLPKETHFTANEVARLYRKKVTTIRKWAREGKLPAKKFGGKNWLFHKKHIHADLAELGALDYFDNATRLSKMASFDILNKQDRIDVKSSSMRDFNGKLFWSFTIDLWGKKSANYCDYLFCFCYDKSHSVLFEAYLIPFSKLREILGAEKKKTFGFSIKKNSSRFKKFRLPKLEIPAFIRRGRK